MSFFIAAFRRAILAMGLLFFAAAMVSAGGKKQSDLAKADTMVQEKNYGKAIQLLVEFARENPEQFDQVQERLRDIMSLMDDYTVVANALLDMVVNNPENLDNILDISRQLTSMNAARRNDIGEFIANIEEVARFTVNRRELERILREGGDLLSQKQYVAALQMYQSGFNLYQEQMYLAGYGEDVGVRTRIYLDNIDNFIASAQTIIEYFENVRSTISPLSGSIQDAGTLLAAYNNISPYLDELIEAKSNSALAVRYFEEQTEITEAEELKHEGRFFFPMAAVFIQGRTNEALREGVLGAIDAIWDIASDPLIQLFTTAAGAYFSQTSDLINREAFSSAISLLETTSGFNRSPLSLIEKWTAFDMPDAAVEDVLGQAVSADHCREFLYLTGLENINGYLLRACEAGISFLSTKSDIETQNLPAAWEEGRISAADAVLRELEWRRNYESYAGALINALDDLNAEASRYRAAIPEDIESGSANGRPDTLLFNTARSTLEVLRIKLLDAPVQTAFEQYTIANGNLNKELSRLEELFTRENNMLNGTPLTLADGSEITALYPREAAELSTEIDTELQAQIELTQRLLSDYQSESGLIAGNRAINELSVEARSIAARFSNLRIRNDDARALALARVNRSQTLIAEGRSLLGTAQASLARSDLDTAQDEAYRSMSRFTDSLSIQESPALRNEIAARLTPLIAEIVQLRYELVVREVRGLVNTARERYFEGKFDQAEETLVRAEGRWTTISAEPDTEVNYWLTLVRGAIFMQGGRTIPVTAPLYPEMSQLLSGARRNYEDGVRMLSNNRREDGLQMFAAAIQKTQEVRLLFPVNQDAGILELQIEQVLDPAVFNQNFAQRFQAAVAGTRSGNLEAFADLQDLAHINPNYPGIRAAIVQAEISMGIRPAPPDPRRLARSNELAAAAQRMFSANIRSQYPLVLENLNEALRLNPNNTLAMQVKDRVQVAMGSVSTVDSQTEQEYMRAVRELQNGNNLLALSIVQRLLQSPENRDSVRLNELLRRIEAGM